MIDEFSFAGRIQIAHRLAIVVLESVQIEIRGNIEFEVFAPTAGIGSTF